jgi:Rrf2 family protein
MKLSEGVEWSAHCAVVLAGLPAGAAMSGAALAEFHGVSESYLVKHLQALVRAGILASVPGPKGGFRLARPPDQVTLLDVVRAIDGPEHAFRCTEIRQRGPSGLPPSAYRLPCLIHASMARAEGAWRAELAAQPLSALAAAVAASNPGAIEKAVPWLQEHVREARPK